MAFSLPLFFLTLSERILVPFFFLIFAPSPSESSEPETSEAEFATEAAEGDDGAGETTTRTCLDGEGFEL